MAHSSMKRRSCAAEEPASSTKRSRAAEEPASSTKSSRAAEEPASRRQGSSEAMTAIAAARAAMANSCCKHSHYRVGACLEAQGGRRYTGVNVESDSFGLTICAERVALFKALSEGEREFVSLVCATRDGGPSCGGCRQLLREYCEPCMPVLFVSTTAVVRETTVGAMLPDPFVLS